GVAGGRRHHGRGSGGAGDRARVGGTGGAMAVPADLRAHDPTAGTAPLWRRVRAVHGGDRGALPLAHPRDPAGPARTARGPWLHGGPRQRARRTEWFSLDGLAGRRSPPGGGPADRGGGPAGAFLPPTPPRVSCVPSPSP